MYNSFTSNKIMYNSFTSNTIISHLYFSPANWSVTLEYPSYNRMNEPLDKHKYKINKLKAVTLTFEHHHTFLIQPHTSSFVPWATQ